MITPIFGCLVGNPDHYDPNYTRTLNMSRVIAAALGLSAVVALFAIDPFDWY